MSLLVAACLHELKITYANLGPSLQDRKDATVSKTRQRPVFVVVEIASLLVVDEINILLGKLRNLLGFLGDLQLACCSTKAGKINLNWVVGLLVVVGDDVGFIRSIACRSF